MKKRMLSILLAIIMVLALIPSYALPEAEAENTEGTDAEEITITYDYGIFKAGNAVPTASNFRISSSLVRFTGVFSSDDATIWSAPGTSFVKGKYYCVEFSYSGPDNPDIFLNGQKQAQIQGFSAPYTYQFILGTPPCLEYEECTWRTVNDRDSLKYYLELPGTAYIKLGSDIETEIGPLSMEDKDVGLRIDLEIYVHGEKVLDLNGHNITNDDCRNAIKEKKHGNDDYNGKNKANMFEVCAGADMTVIDTEGSGRIFHDGYYIGTSEIGGEVWDTYTSGCARDLFHVYGKLTVNGGKLVAGGSKRQYLSDRAKYAYQIVHGTDVRVMKGGTFIANGGTFIANGATESMGDWNNDWYMSYCIKGAADSEIVINGGTYTGYCCDVVEVDEKAHITVRAGEFKTAKCGDHVRPAHERVWREGLKCIDAEYGHIGIPKTAFDARTVVKQNHESVYNPDSDGNTTVTPADYISGGVVTVNGNQEMDYNTGTDSNITFRFDRLFPEDSLLMNPAGTGEAASKYNYRRNGIAGYQWTLYKKTNTAGNAMWESVWSEPVSTTEPVQNLRTLYSGWEHGETYMLKAKAIEYWSGSTDSFVLNVISAKQLTIRVLPVEKLDYVKVQMNESGLLVGTEISHYKFTSDNPAIASVLINWYKADTGEKLSGLYIVQDDEQYYAELTINTVSGYQFDLTNYPMVEYNGYASCISSYYSQPRIARWYSEDLTPSIPTEVYVEGELLSSSKTTHSCSGGGKAIFDPYSNTLTLENAVIRGADLRGKYGFSNNVCNASYGIYIDQAKEYDDVGVHDYAYYTRTLFTIALKGENVIDVDRIAYTENSGRTTYYGEGIESRFSLKIIQGDEEGSLKFTGTAVDSIYVLNEYDSPFDYDDDDNNIGLFIEAPVTDFSGGFYLDEVGYFYVGGAGSFRGEPMDAWGPKLEDGFYYYATWNESVPIEERRAEFKYTADKYVKRDAYAYIEIGRDYGVTVQTEGWYQVYVNSANADDVLHDGGSVKFKAQELPVLTLTDAELRGGSEPAINVECYWLSLSLYGDNTITMYGNQKGNEYIAFKNDGGVTRLGGTGNLTIRAEEEGMVYGWGILSNNVKINMSGSLIIRDAITGITTAGIQTPMSGGQMYMDRLDYSTGMVTIYVPELPADSVYKYRNCAVSHAPKMVGGSWAGEWMCYVGNENDLTKASRYYGEASASMEGYRYLKLWRSGTNFIANSFSFAGTSSADRVKRATDAWEAKLIGFDSNNLFIAEQENIYASLGNASVGNEIEKSSDLEIEKSYWYIAKFPMNGKLPGAAERLYVHDDYSHIDADIPFLKSSEAQNYPGSCAYYENDRIILKYKFTMYGFLVKANWAYSDGQSTLHNLYADGEMIVQRDKLKLTYNGECTENGFAMNIPDRPQKGDVLTLTVPGYVAKGDNSIVYSGQKDWVVDFYLLGDVNNDGTLTIFDVSRLFRWWNGSTSLYDDKLLLGDVDENGVTDLRDATALFRILNK